MDRFSRSVSVQTRLYALWFFVGGIGHLRQRSFTLQSPGLWSVFCRNLSPGWDLNLGTRGEEVTLLPSWISGSIKSFFVKKLTNYCPKFIIGTEQAWSLLEPLCKWPTATGSMNHKKKNIFPLTAILFLFIQPQLVRICYESSSFSKYFKIPFTVRLLCLVNHMNHRADRPWCPPILLHNWYCVFPGGKAAGTWHWPHNPT